MGACSVLFGTIPVISLQSNKKRKIRASQPSILSDYGFFHAGSDVLFFAGAARAGLANQRRRRSGAGQYRTALLLGHGAPSLSRAIDAPLHAPLEP